MGILGREEFGMEAEEKRRADVSRADRDTRAPAAETKIIGTSRAGQRPPKIKGLTLSTSPGAIEASWDAPPILDLKRFDVQISTSPAFVNPTTLTVRGLRVLFEDGVAGAVYYFRVRAVNSGETEGVFSNTASASPGDIDTAELADGSVTEPKIATNAVTADKIATGAVGGDEIASGAVDTDELAAGAVTLQDDDFTAAGQATQVSDETTMATATITSVGGRVRIHASFMFTAGTTGDTFTIRIKRGATVIWSDTYVTTSASTTNTSFAAILGDTPTAGSRTYTLTVQRTSGSTDTLTTTNASIFVVELKR
jgi:hypothetical protein